MYAVKNLIVTADDFGAAVEVNRAVERAHRDGILSAASLMVAGPAANDAVQRAKAMPPCAWACIWCWWKESRCCRRQRCPTWWTRPAISATDMARAGAAMFFLPRVRAQLAAEIEAQFAAFEATGLKLDHVNAHKHFHLHPTIAALDREAGQGAWRAGARACRWSRKPCWAGSRSKSPPAWWR